MHNRTCTVVKEVVSNVSGQEVVFQHGGSEEDSDVLGGMEQTIDPDDRHTADSVQLYNFTTTTVTEVLSSHKAPMSIDFLSIDVEGAEEVVLQGFDLDKFCVRFATIEHNGMEPLRSNLREAFESYGHKYGGTEAFDDYYVKDC